MCGLVLHDDPHPPQAHEGLSFPPEPACMFAAAVTQLSLRMTRAVKFAVKRPSRTALPKVLGAPGFHEVQAASLTLMYSAVSRGYGSDRHGMLTIEADVRIQLLCIWPDVKKVCKSVK